MAIQRGLFRSHSDISGSYSIKVLWWDDVTPRLADILFRCSSANTSYDCVGLPIFGSLCPSLETWADFTKSGPENESDIALAQLILYAYFEGTRENLIFCRFGSSWRVAMAIGNEVLKSKWNWTPAGGFLRKFLLSWKVNLERVKKTCQNSEKKEEAFSA